MGRRRRTPGSGDQIGTPAAAAAASSENQLLLWCKSSRSSTRLPRKSDPCSRKAGVIADLDGEALPILAPGTVGDRDLR